MEIGKLISALIGLGITLMIAGKLVPVTRWLMIEAVKSTQHGLISLGDLSRSLEGAPPKHPVHHNGPHH